ncbi:hypothetical protein IC229_29765 [Spirosoma sp. BT702]|uniref:Dystroglycan-type cadherin-like domain-containing protein n=1 Tax=Spirosoma profusum TaxID=2771354 RepID=A0A927G9Q2_9BACT|nr:putative Ig domain-containing protein [Spirosoma profusum]MBD2704856.1 hypothetical protein [Spirosoma profusum]
MPIFTLFDRYRNSCWTTFWLALVFITGLAVTTPAQTFDTDEIESGLGCSLPFSSLATHPTNGNMYGFWKKGDDLTYSYKLIRFDGSNWITVSTLPAVSGFERPTDDLNLAIDSDGGFHVVFVGSRGDATSGPKVVFYGYSANGTSWVFTEIESYSTPNGFKAPFDPVVEIDAANRPHIVFVAKDAAGSRFFALRYFTYNGSSWTGVDAFSQSGGSAGNNHINVFDFALDSDGKAHIAFQRETDNSGTDGGLWYINNTSGSWPSTPQELAHGTTGAVQGNAISMDIDAANKVHIVHTDTQNRLLYLNNVSGSFSSSQINSNLVGSTYFGGFVINSNGDRFVAYSNNGLKYAYLLAGASGNWTTGTAYTIPSGTEANPVSAILTADRRIMYLFGYKPSGSCSQGSSRSLWYTTATLPGPPVNATVSSISTTSPGPTNASSINFAVTFDKTVTGVGSSNFVLTTSGVSGASVGTVTGSGSTRNVAVNTGTGSGTIRLDMANTSGVAPTVTNVPFTTGTTVTIDKTGPAVSSVTIPANNTYRTGQDLTFTVQFNDNVNVTGLPYLTLTIGSTNVQAFYTGGSGTSALTFKYTVLAGQQDNDGVQVGSPINLNSGSLKDGLGNDANLTLNTIPNTAGVKVDAIVPTVSISSSAGTSGSTTSTSPIPVTVTFSESVTGLLANEVTVTNGMLGGFGGSGATYTFNVTPAANGLITINVAANVAQDAAGNNNSAAAQFSITYSQPVTPTPEVNTPANGTLITTNTPTYSGTASAGSTVVVYVDGSTIGSTTATGGNWSLLQPSALSNSSHSVRATAQLSGQAVSVSSNTNSFTVDISTLSLALSANAVCVNGSLSLTATASNIGSPVIYSLSSSPAGFAGSGTSPQFTLSAPSVGSPTTYTLTVAANSNAGNASATAVVTVNPIPTPSITNLASSYCKNAADVPLSGSPTGGVFTVDGTIALNFSPGNLLVGQHTVVYSYTNVNGCSATTSQSVIVNLTPSPILVASGTLTCALTSATLTASGGTTYQFGGPGVVNQSGNTAFVNVAGIYSVTATNGSSCSSTTTVNVVQDNSAPSVSIMSTSATLTCANPSATLTANGVGTYQWSTGAATSSISVSIATTYSVTLTGTNGCTATTSAQVDQNINAPSVSITPSTGTPAGTTLTCANPSVNLVAGGDGTYRWSTGANTASISVNAADTYSVTVTSANGCTASASIQVAQDTNVPSLTITPTSATLTCANPSATLTANGVGTYQWSTGATTPSISVSIASTYSLTLTGNNGCKGITSAQVSQDNSVPVPSLQVSALTTVNQPISVTASGCSGTLNWQVQGGTGQASGNIYTLSTPGTYTLTATCTVGNCTSPPAPAQILMIQAPNTNFAITSVNMVNCYKTNPSRGQYVVQFTPRYTGQNGNPISFSVVNEMAPTTQPAPYTLNLYQDNPIITLVANQAGNGETRYVYNWLASCSTGSSPNQPPTTVGISAQTATLNQPFQLNLSGYFTDPEGQTLTYSAQGLPAGLNVVNTLLSGTPSQTGMFGVTITAIDPGNLSVSATFTLTVQAQSTQPTNFAIVGVTSVSCEVLKVAQRRVRFTPQYSGLTGQPVTFRVVNELPATNQPGPYSLDLYTDNPVLELRASQAGTAGEVSYSFNWLAACGSTPPVNAAPTVTQSIPNQVGVVGQAFTYSIPVTTFTDPNGDALVLTTSSLPAGLTLNGSVISGTPSASGVSTVFITATDPGGLSASTSFVFTINQVTVPPTGIFAITGVQLLNCQAVSAQQRLIRFSPQYSGLTGQPVSFSVVNELAPTTAGGPYELRLYTDNPVILLKAVQAGTAGEASFSYNWLAACSTPARQSAEKLAELSVQVLGNPVAGEWVDVLIEGAYGRLLHATTVNGQGVSVDSWQTASAADQERIRLRVGASGGIYLLKVETSSQRRTIKLLKH